MSRRGLLFAAIVLGCLLLGGGWVLVAAQEHGSTTSTSRVGLASDPPPSSSPQKLRGQLLARTVDPRDARLNGQVTGVSLGTGAKPRDAGRLACQRVHFAAGAGLCLALAKSGVEYRARLFDRHYRVRHELTLTGLPSRARVSPGGRWGAITTFVSGDAYAASGTFSTRTWIIDMRSGRRAADLEQFEVIKDGKRIDSPDFNFWGVTFARDEDTFYATLATGGKRYLVKGSRAAQRVEVLRANVECPSLSPDGTRLAYKKRVGKVEDWRLHVLDLASGRDIALAERRSIDDQAEWLNDDTVVYGDGHAVWAVPADGTGSPRRVLARADSPAAVHGGA